MRLAAYLLLLVALFTPGEARADQRPLPCELNFALVENPQADLYPRLLANLDLKLTPGQDAALQSLFKNGELAGREEKMGDLLLAIKQAAVANDPEEFKYLTLVYSQPENYTDLPPAVARAAYAKVKKSQTPYSTGYDLGGSTGNIRSLDEILAFQKIQSLPAEAAAESVHQWVKSPAHALYLYQHLGEFGESATAILSYLIERNEFFKRVGRVRGPPNTLVAMAFEKETRKREISLLYRDAKLTDDEWLNLSDEERFSRLEKLIVATKRAADPKVVAPTSLRPNSVGGLMREPLPSGEASLFEFAHKSYEIDPAQITRGMNDVAGLFKEKDFHVHLTFDLPVNYPRMEEFTSWVKHAGRAINTPGPSTTPPHLEITYASP